MPAPASLDWSMTLNKGGDALDVHYTLKNTTDRRIYAMDLLPRPGKKSFVYDPNFFIVMNGATAGTVAFVRGRVQSEAPVAVLIDPGGRAIEPGESVEGSGTVPLPLKGAHYQGTVAPIQGSPTKAELEICVLTGDVHWSYLQLDDGSNLTMSSPSDPITTIKGGAKAIPGR